MHVVVVGCGRVGSELAATLHGAGHSVAVVDKNPRSFQHYHPQRWGGRYVIGFGFDRDHLEQAGIREATALAATAGGDNSNILTARIARETFEVPNVVARIQDPRRAVIYERLGIPTVAQVRWTTDQVMRRLFPDESSVEWTDLSGELTLLERALPAVWAGRKLAGIGQAGRFRVTAVTRSGAARLTGPDMVGQEGDILHIMVTKADLDELDGRLASGSDT